MIWGIEGRHLWLPYGSVPYPMTPDFLAKKLAAGAFLPSALGVSSKFDTESGDLSGDALALGGNWTIIGPSATHLSAAGGVATRSAVGEADNYFSGGLASGSGAVATPSLTDFVAALRFRRSANPVQNNTAHNVLSAIFFDWSSASAWMNVAFSVGSDLARGAATNSVVSINKGGFGGLVSSTRFRTDPNVDYVMVVWRSGTSMAVFFGPDDGSPLEKKIDATGLSIAPTSGPIGLWDMASMPEAVTRTYNSLDVWTTGTLPYVTLNRVLDDAGAQAFPRYKVQRITGLASSGESGDRRDVRVGAQGEIPRRSYRRGKTITYEGRVQALTRASLRAAESALVSAFDDQEFEGLVVASPHPLYDGSGAYRFFNARALTCEIDDSAGFSPNRMTQGHESPFVIALRNARAGGVSYTDEAGVTYA